MSKARRPRNARREPLPAPLQEVAPAPRIWRRHLRHLWRLVALGALILAAYSNSFQAGFVFDNGPLILRDDRVHEVTLANLGQILNRPYWVDRPDAGIWRPLTTVSYLLNYTVLSNGPHPAGYHWVNLALHAINVWLVYGLALQIFEEAALALMMAALWGLHPLLTEAVTNIVGRADLLAAFGVLAGLLCYIKATASGTTRQAPTRQTIWIAAMTAALTVGIFSKESAAVLPGLMLLYDLTWPGRTTWRRRAFSYAALTLPFAVWLVLRSRVPMHLQFPVVENVMSGAGFWTARVTAVTLIGKLVGLFVWPDPLAADYSWHAVHLFSLRLTGLRDAQALLYLAICAAMLVLAIRCYRRQKPVFFFLLFFFIALAPVSNLIVLIGATMAERFAYLPSVGLAGCAVAAVWALCGKLFARPSVRLRSAAITIGLLCLACAVRTYARNFDWYDERSLWTATVRAVPENAKAHLNLGNVFIRQRGELENAIGEYQTALRIEPSFSEAHNDLGNALSQMPGRLPDAIAEYKTALRIKPDYADAHSDLGIALSNMNRLPEAVAEFQTALRLEPENARVHYNLGLALARLPGLAQDAISEMETALRNQPDLPDVHIALGNILAQESGDLPGAVAHYRAALQLRPDDVNAHNNLGNTLARMPGRLPEAIAEFEAALAIDPRNVTAHRNLGLALSQTPGRLPEAMAELEKALRIRPDPQTARMLERLRAVRP